MWELQQERAYGSVIQGCLDASFGIYPFRDFEGQAPGDVRIRILHLEVVGLGLAAFLQQQHVWKSGGREESRARDLALDDAVRCPCRAVNKQTGSCQQIANAEPELFAGHGETGFDAGERALPVGQRFADSETPFFVSDDYIGKSAAGVDGYAVGHV